MATKQRDTQVVIRIATPLRDELRLAAERDHRTVADMARQVLVTWAAQQVIDREQSRAA